MSIGQTHLMPSLWKITRYLKPPELDCAVLSSRNWIRLPPIAEDVLERLQVERTLPSRAFRSAERVHGAWDNKLPNTKATSHVLNLLLDAGMIRVVERKGTERSFDLTAHTAPLELLQHA